MKKDRFPLRLRVLGGFVLLCFLFCAVVMFDAQIVNGAAYLARSSRLNTERETVEASRGVITDRNGKVIVSNRTVYTLSFDASLVEEARLNDAILSLLTLLRSRDAVWSDELPLTDTQPLEYRPGSDSQLRTLTAYLAEQGRISADDADENGAPKLSPSAVFRFLRELYGIDPSLSAEEARGTVGFRYSLALAARSEQTSFVFVPDADISLIALLKDGGFDGVRVGSSSVRVYETDAAAHVLGHVGKLTAEEYAALRDKGYAYNDTVGKDGVERAFEDYLRGTDGTRLVTVNAEGKVTSQLYSVEPQNGDTVTLTLDIDFQEKVEQALAKNVGAMVRGDGVPRAAAAAVVEIGTGDVLALASYPTYSLATYNEDYAALSQSALSPYVNRATNGLYAPGSTFKPLTAIAALETGVITPDTRIRTLGQYVYYDLRLNCWLYSSARQTHGTINVTQAITESCNYFFYDVGRMTGISTLARYAKAFGLGEPTGIEIPERRGAMTTPDYVNSIPGHRWTDGQTLTAAIGQSYNQFTPLQLANYIATLAGGGKRYPAHLLKSVKAHDSPNVIAVFDEPPTAELALDPNNLHAVLDGMRKLVTQGSVSNYFRDCVVDAAAKTGTAQTGRGVNNGVFVCFAPYDDPQIAVAVVIEKGGSGGAVATTAVDILNAYFSGGSVSPAGENELLR